MGCVHSYNLIYCFSSVRRVPRLNRTSINNSIIKNLRLTSLKTKTISIEKILKYSTQIKMATSTVGTDKPIPKPQAGPAIKLKKQQQKHRVNTPPYKEMIAEVIEQQADKHGLSRERILKFVIETHIQLKSHVDHHIIKRYVNKSLASEVRLGHLLKANGTNGKYKLAKQKHDESRPRVEKATKTKVTKDTATKSVKRTTANKKI